MGKRGPSKKPLKLKLDAGNPGHQKLPKVVARFAEVHKTVDPPSQLDDLGREIFGKILPQLQDNGFVNDANVPDIAGGCQWMSLHFQMIEQLKSQGLWEVVETKNGSTLTYTSAAFRALKDTTKEVRLFLREYGLTPSSVSDVSPIIKGVVSLDDI